MAEGQTVRLPTYESLHATNLPGFSNPRYEVGEMGRGDVVEGERERGGERRGEEEGEDLDDLPPPYSPGIVGQQPGTCY